MRMRELHIWIQKLRVIDYIKKYSRICTHGRWTGFGIRNARSVFVSTGRTVWTDQKTVRRRKAQTESAAGPLWKLPMY